MILHFTLYHSLLKFVTDSNTELPVGCCSESGVFNSLNEKKSVKFFSASEMIRCMFLCERKGRATIHCYEYRPTFHKNNQLNYKWFPSWLQITQRSLSSIRNQKNPKISNWYNISLLGIICGVTLYWRSAEDLQKTKQNTEPASYLPARSNLDMHCSLSVPEDCDVFLWEMNHCEVPSWPDEHYLLPVNHTGWILHKRVTVVRWQLSTEKSLNLIQKKQRWHTKTLCSTSLCTSSRNCFKSDSYWLPSVIIKSNKGSSNIDQQGLPADDSTVKTVDVLSCDTEHYISTALWRWENTAAVTVNVFIA